MGHPTGVRVKRLKTQIWGLPERVCLGTILATRVRVLLMDGIALVITKITKSYAFKVLDDNANCRILATSKRESGLAVS